MTVQLYPLGSRSVTAREIARAWMAFVDLRERGQLEASPCSPHQLDAALTLGWKASLFFDNEGRYLARMQAHPHDFYLGCQEVVDLVRPGRQVRIDPAMITSVHEVVTGHAVDFPTLAGATVEQWAHRFAEAHGHGEPRTRPAPEPRVVVAPRPALTR